MRMDATSIWLHNVNIDRTLNRLGTYVDPSERAALLKFLVEEEDQLGAGPEQSEHIERRVREGRARISRVLAIIEGLIERDLMNEKAHYKAMAVLTALRQSQTLLEQLSRRV